MKGRLQLDQCTIGLDQMFIRTILSLPLINNRSITESTTLKEVGYVLAVKTVGIN